MQSDLFLAKKEIKKQGLKSKRTRYWKLVDVIKKSKVRYALRVFNPKTKKWKISDIGSSLEKVGKKIADNLMFNKDWYTDENGKRLKLKLTAEEKDKKGNITVWEEYKITKDWKVKGYFTNWEKMTGD